jgi:hypothetical protein
MAYTSFRKLEQLRKSFGIEDIQSQWMPKTFTPVNVSDHLLQNLLDAQEESLRTEKAKSEYVIAPILKELRRNNRNRFSSFSGFELSVDKERGLTGFCDFILSAEPNKVEISAPIFCLVEAKKDDVEKGTAQCGAEMYAAKLYNEQEGKPRKVIYGCVTTAFSWCFLKLEDNTLYIDPNYIPLTFTEPHRILAALQWVLEKSLNGNK